MRTKIFVIILVVLFGTQSLCIGETWELVSREVVTKEKASAEVEIYITDWCPYCKKAIKFLKANNIKYVAYDIEKNSEAAERKRELSERKGVPFAIINGKKYYGFSEEMYSDALDINR